MYPDDVAPFTDGGTAPEDSFALVGNEIRIEILRVLGEESWTALPFSELRSRVGRGLDSGRFNYHLQQLVGVFVEEVEDGYRLRPQGVSLYGAVRAGTFTRGVDVEPFDAGFDCYSCEGTVEGRYGDGVFGLSCLDCGQVYSYTKAPPSAAEGVDPATLLERVSQYNRHELLAFSRGVCPTCANGLDVSFVRAEDAWLEGADDFEALVRSACAHCGSSHLMSVGGSLLYHPALVSFFYERGLDVTTGPHWLLEFAMTGGPVTVRSTDPWEVCFRVERDGEALELVLDGEANVTEGRVVEVSDPSCGE